MVKQIVEKGNELKNVVSLFAPNEARAPIEKLSSAKKRALVACLKGNGTLHKRYGVWASIFVGAHEMPISGNTVADLARDGMLTIIMDGKVASAQFTTLGSWFARTICDNVVEIRPPLSE